ncbi:DUF3040 domain-containing protein [Actinoplanes solisilvae]|uniref:DUF3040 domain-containing protein n=1 Tax=Actinoplanes solisilvae TaxID=2486853 RepID=UPI0013E3F71D|nr:DUF3040 domain-containing protein [Actinoplanes solisilvae]
MEAERHNPKFDEIVTHLVTEDPSFGAATRTPLAWNRAARVAIIAAAAVLWAGLSVLMVVWGWRGALVAVPVVVAGVVIAVHLTRGAGTKAQTADIEPPARDEAS